MTEKFWDKPLEREVFKNWEGEKSEKYNKNEKLHFENFQDILSILDEHITPSFIDRKKFNEKRWNFLESTWKKDKFWNFFTLYLPVDIKISELPAIIYRVTKYTTKL